MSSQNDNYVVAKLSHPTIFPDLNAIEGKEKDFARDSIKINRLKFKHIKNMQNVSEEKQMFDLISKLTQLSESDMDELYAEDAAEITSVVFGFMEKYVLLAKKMSG
jgi:hypothetical protein